MRKDRKRDFRITISQPKLSTNLASSGFSSRKQSQADEQTSFDPSHDLKAKSFNLSMNANQYLVKSTASSVEPIQEASKKVSQASQTAVQSDPLIFRKEYEIQRKQLRERMESDPRSSVLFKLPPLPEQVG